MQFNIQNIHSATERIFVCTIIRVNVKVNLNNITDLPLQWRRNVFIPK